MRALAAAERRWPLIGWVRVTLGGNVGEGAAPGPPALGVIPVPVYPSLIPGAGTGTGSGFSDEVG